MARLFYHIAFIVSLSLTSACSDMQFVKGDPFQHAYLLKGEPVPGGRVYVYLHEDGAPWIDRIYISKHPILNNPITLKLMHKGPLPAVYLGRPCYYGLDNSVPCDPRDWTSARYSSTAVTSMRAALAQILAAYPDLKITLIGYSGGGTLAALIAADLAGVDQLVTLAGNLDTDAWTERHNYMPLNGSLNPALQKPLPASIRQYHFAGELDHNVTVNMIQNFVVKQDDAEVILLPEFTHQCCWEQAWPELIKQLNN